jgi:hypothetical protein
MATKITNAALITAGKELLAYAKQTMIPYVNNGMTLKGMDCQGLVEYCLIRAGVPERECGLAGSNAHWRKCVWTGTPEECKAAFGCIPGGAALFIWQPDGAPAKYDGDGRGNATHVGLWLGDTSIAASASRGYVIESNFKGASINGGWNRVGLLPWVDYGLTDTQKAALAAAAPADEAAAQPATATVDTSAFVTVDMAHKCKGGAVERLQTWLNDLGYGLTVDHAFGPKTDAAVRQFQQAQGLTADGIVGKQTWAALAAARATAAEGAQG